MLFNFGNLGKGDSSGIFGSIGKYLSAAKTMAAYKINPGQYTTTEVIQPTYDYSKLTDQGLIDLNSYFKDSFSAKSAIEGMGISDLDAWFSERSEVVQANLQPIWDNVKNGTATVKDLLKSSFGTMPTIVKTSVSESITQAQSVWSAGVGKIKNLALNFASIITNVGLTMLATMVATKVLPAAIDFFDNLIHHSERLIEKGEEARQKIDDIYDAFEKGNDEIKDIAIAINIDDAENKTVKQNLDEIAERYSELKKGVDQLSNANKSLSTEKYAEYLKISNELAKKFPSLVRGYDDQGNAVLTLSDNAVECKGSLSEVYQVSMDIANVDISENLKDAFNGIIERAKVARDELEKLKESSSEAEAEIEERRNPSYGNAIRNESGSVGFSFTDQEDYGNWLSKVENIYEEWLDAEEGRREYQQNWSQASQDLRNTFSEFEYSRQEENDNKVTVALPEIEFFQSEENIQKMENALKEAIDETNQQEIETLETELKENAENIVLQNREIQAANAELVKTITQTLKTDDVFSTFNDTLKDMILTNLSTWVNDKSVGEDIGDNYSQWIEDNITNPLGSISDEIQQQIADVISKDYSGGTLEEYMANITNSIMGVVNDAELTQDIMKYSGVDQMIKEYTERIQTIVNHIPELSFSDVYKMTLSEINNGYDIVLEGAIESKEEFFKRLYEKPVKIPNEGLLSDIFNDENYTREAEIIEKNLSAISSAIKSAQETNGVALGDAAKSLREQMKDTDFGDILTIDNLQDEGINQLTKWVDLLYKTADAEKLTEDAMKNLDEYVQNLVMSYKDLGASSEGLMDQISKNYANILPGIGKHEAISGFKEEFEKEFEKELGDEDDRKILYYLSLNPDSATWDADKWREEYNNAKITWDLILNTTEFEKQMAVVESRVSLAEADESYQKTKAENKNKQGNYDTTEEIDKQIEDEMTKLVGIMNKRDALFDVDNPESVAHRLTLDESDPNHLREGTEKYEEAINQRQAALTGLNEQQEQVIAAIDELRNRKLLIPVTIIDNTTLNDLKREYGDLQKDLEKYGEDAPIDLDLFGDLTNNITEQMSGQKRKIAIFDSLLQTAEGDFKEQVETLRKEAQDEYDQLNEDLFEYAQRSGYGNEQRQIAALKADKAVTESMQSLLNGNLGKDDYEALNNYNEQIKLLYDSIINTITNKMAEIKGNKEVEELGVKERVEWETLNNQLQTFVSERNEIIKEIDDNNKLIDNLPNLGSLENIFGNTDYQEKADKIQEALSAITNAINNLKDAEDGVEILSSDIEALQGANVEMGGDYSISSLNEKNLEYLSKWIRLLYEQADAQNLSASGMQDLEKYILSISQAYKDVSISAEDVMDVVGDSISGISGLTATERSEKKTDFEKEFEDELGNKEDREILFYLTLNTDFFEKDAEEQRNMFEGVKLNWELILDTTEFDNRIKDMELAVAKAQADAQRAATQRQLDNARGIYSNDANYINEQITAKQVEIRGNNAKIQGLLNGTSPESVLYRLQNGEINKNDQDAIRRALSEQNTNIQNLRNANISLEVDITGLEDEKTMLPLTNMENELQVLQTEAANLNDIISDDKHITSVETYNEAINNTTEQVKVLKKEEEFYQKLLNNPVLEKNGQKYLEYSQKLNAVKNTIKDLTESQKEYNQALNNIPIDQANNRLNAINNDETIHEAEIKLKEAKGGKKETTDYVRENSRYLNTKKDQDAIVEQTAENMRNKIVSSIPEVMENIRVGIKVQPNIDQKYLETQLQENVAATQDSLNAEANYYKNLHDYEQQVIDDLNEELTKRQDITESMVDQNATNYTNKQLQIPEKMQQKVLESYDDQLEQAYKLRDQLISNISEHTLNGVQDEYAKSWQKDLNSLEKTINSINNSKLEINTELSQRNLNDLKTNMVDIERTISRLQTSLEDPNASRSNKDILNDLIDTSYEALENLKESASEYEKLMEGDIAVAESMGIALEHSTAYQQHHEEYEQIIDDQNELIKNIIQYREELLKLPENRIQRSLDVNSARRSLENAGLQARTNAGDTLTQSDYKDLINLDNSAIRQQEAMITAKRKELAALDSEIAQEIADNGEVSETLLVKRTNALIAVYDAESELYNAMETLANDQKAANDAILNEYNRRQEFINDDRMLVEGTKTKNEAKGVKRDAAQIQAEISVSKTSLDNVNTEIEKLEEKYKDGLIEPLVIDGETVKTAEEVYHDLYKKLYEDQVTFESELNNLLWEQEELPVKEMEETYEKAAKEYSDFKDAINDKIENGTIKAEDFTMLEELWKAMNSAGLMLEGAWGGLAQTAHEKDADAKEEEYEEKRRSAKATNRSNKDEKEANEDLFNAQPINTLQRAMKDIKRDASDINYLLSDEDHVNTAEDYESAISNAKLQMSNLVEQEAYWNNMIETMQNAPAIDYNVDEMETYKDNLESVQEEMKELTKQQEAWAKAIKQLGIDEVNKKIETYEKRLKSLQNTISLNEAKGISKTMDDYKAEDAEYERIRDRALETAKNLESELLLNVHFQVIDPNSQEYDDAKEVIQGFYDKAFDMELNLANNARAEEFLPVDELQKELDEYKLIGEEIAETISNESLDGGRATTEQYDNQKDNLNDQLDILKQMHDMYLSIYQDNKGTEIGDEALKGLRNVNSEISNIGEQIINIDTEVNDRSLVDLQSEMDILKTEADELQEALNNPSATSMSREDVLGSIIEKDKERIENLKEQADIYSAKMEEIQNTDDEYVFNTIWQAAYTGLSNVNAELTNVNSNLKETKNTLDNIDIEKYEALIARNQAIEGREEAKRGLKTSQGQLLSSEDYTTTLNRLEDDIVQKQGIALEKANDLALKQALKNAHNGLIDKGVTTDKDGNAYNLEQDEIAIREASIALENANTDVLTAQKNLADTQAQANKADQAQYETRISMLNTLRDRLVSEREALEATTGEQRGESQINEDIGLSQNMINALQDALDYLDNNWQDANMTELEYLQQRASYIKQINDEEVKTAGYEKEISELIAKAPKNAMTRLQDSRKEIDSMIAEYTNLDKEVPDDLLNKKLGNIEAQKSQANVLYNIFNTLAEGRKLLFGEDDATYLEWKQQAQEYKEQVDNLTSESIDTQNMIDNKGLTHLGYQLDELKREGEDLQRVLSKKVKPDTSDYEKAISNMVSQNKNLNEQIAEVKSNMDGLDPNDTKYEEYQGQLFSLKQEIQSNIDTLVEWQQELDMLNFDRASEALEKYIDTFNKQQNKKDNEVSLGYRMTEEDYQNDIETYQHIVESAQRNAQNAKDKIDQMELDNPTGFIDMPEYEKAQTAYEEQLQIADEYAQKIAETNQKIEVLPLDEMERGETELDHMYDSVLKVGEAWQTAGYDIPTAVLDEQNRVLDEQIKQLEGMAEIADEISKTAYENSEADRGLEFQEKAYNYRQQIDEKKKQKYENNQEKANRPLTAYERQMDSLSSEQEVLENLLGNLEDASGAQAENLYGRIDGIIKKRMGITESMMEFHKTQMHKLSQEAALASQNVEENTMYQEHKANLESLTKTYQDFDKILKDHKKVVEEMPKLRLESEQNLIDSEKAKLQAQQSKDAALGVVSDEETLHGLVINAEADLNLSIQNLDIAEDDLERAQNQLEDDLSKISSELLTDDIFSVKPASIKANEITFDQNNLNGISIEQDKLDVNTAKTNVNTAEADVVTSETNLYENKKAEVQGPVDELKNKIGELKNTTAETTVEIERLVSEGNVGTANQYQTAVDSMTKEIENYTNQIPLLKNLKSVIEEELRQNGFTPDQFGKSNEWNDVVEAIRLAEEETKELNDTTREYLMMINGGIELHALDQQMQDLQAENQKLTDAMNLIESRSQNISPVLTASMSRNVSEQIENLTAQNEQLRKQQETVDLTTDDYRELQQTINENESSINNLIISLEDYNNKLFHIATNSARELQGAVGNALTESLSDTGMTNDSINALIGQFKDLQGFTSMDLSSMFINTAKGVQVNTTALQKMLKVQRQVYSKSLFQSAINGQRAVLNGINKEKSGELVLTKAIIQKAQKTRKGDKAYLEGAAAKLRAINKEIVGYNAIMDAIEMSMSGYQKWQEAENTENPGDRYKNIYEALAEMEQRHNRGEIGTDEYKAFISMFDRWGRTTPDAFNDFYPKFERYFYETNEGVKNFANDMVSKGFGSLNNGVYDFDLSNMDAIVEAFDMSQETLDIMFGRLEDFGFNIVYATNKLQAESKKIETRDDMMNEMARNMSLRANGANQDAITESDERLNILRENLADYRTMLDEFNSPDYHEVTENDYNANVQAIIKAQEWLREAMSVGDEDGAAYYRSWIQGFAEDNGIKLSDDFLSIMSPAYDEWIVEYEAKLQEMAEYIPDLSTIDTSIDGSALTASYKNAYEELKQFAEQSNITVDWDFNTEDTNNTIEDLQQHLAQLQELKINIDGEESPALKSTIDLLMKKTETQLNLKYILENANGGTGVSLEELATMTDDQKKEVIMNAALLTDEQTQNLLEYLNGKQATLPITVNIDQASFDALADMFGKDHINIDTYINPPEVEPVEVVWKELGVVAEETKGSVENLNSAISSTGESGGQATISVDSDTSEAESNADTAKSNIDSKTATMTVDGNTNQLITDANTAKAAIESTVIEAPVQANQIFLQNSVQNALNTGNFQVNVQANVQTNGVVAAAASGTLSAHVEGTDVALKQDEDALVNELGTESIIRDGQWFEIPGGMHVEHLQKSDVILNHKQTEDLKKHGKASGKGKIVGGESALAHGTATNGMPSYLPGSGSGGFVGGEGYFYTDDKTTFQERAGLIDTTVDNLDDLNDGLGDLSDGLDDASQHAEQALDLIQRRLTVLSNITQKFANRMNEWLDTSEKYYNIQKQLASISDEILDSSRGAMRYQQEAYEKAHDFKYYTTDKTAAQNYNNESNAIQSQINALNNNLKALENNPQGYSYNVEKADIQSQINQLKANQSAAKNNASKASSQQIENHLDLSNYMNLEDLRNGLIDIRTLDTSTEEGQAVYDAAQQFLNLMSSAESASQSVQSLANSLIDLYQQIVNLPLEDLEKAITKLDRAMQTLSSFSSASASGEAGMRALSKMLRQTFGKSEAKELFQQVGTAYNTQNQQIKENIELKKQETAANKEGLDNLRDTIADLQSNLSRYQNNNIGVRDTLAMTYMDESDRADFNDNELLDASRFGSHSPEIRETVAQYNNNVAQIKALEAALKEAQDKLEDQEAKTRQSAAETAQAIIEGITQGLDNIDNFYRTFINYNEKVGDLLKANRDSTIQWLGYVGNMNQILKSYTKEIGQTQKNIQQLQVDLDVQKSFLASEMAAGNIKKGDQEWYQYQTRFKELELEIVNAQNAIHSLFDEMAHSPLELASEQVEKLETKWKKVTSAISAGVTATKSMQKSYSRLADELAKKLPGYESDSILYSYSETFKGQNIALGQDMRRMQEDLMANIQASMTADANYEYAKAHPYSYSKEDMESLRRAAEEARNIVTEGMAEISAKEVEYANQAVENINTYYSALSGWQEKLAASNKKNRDYLLEIGTILTHSTEAVGSYATQINTIDQSIKYQEANIASMQGQLDYNVATGKIEYGSEDWIKEIDLIQDAKDRILDMRSEQQQLFKDMVAVPSNVATEKIQKITTAYRELNAAISAGTTETASFQRMSSKISAVTGIGNGEKYNQGETFKGQNQALADDLKQQREITAVSIAAAKSQKQLLDQAIAEGNKSEGQIKALQEAYDQAMDDAVDKQEALAKKEVETAKATVQNIDAYYSSITQNLDNLANSYSKVRDVLNELGRQMDENGDLITDTEQITVSYTKQLEQLRKKQVYNTISIRQQQAQLESVKETIGENTEDYKDLENQIIRLEQEYMDTTIAIDQLQDQMREELYLKPYDEAIEKLQKIRSNLQSVNGLITDTMKLTKDGEWTELGKVSLALDSQTYINSLNSLNEAVEQYYENEKQHTEDISYSDEKYLKRQQEIRETILNNMNEVSSARQAILEAEKARYRQEIDYIQELINAQKKNLQKKKELADYEKNLRKKNDAVKNLEMQRKALESLTDAESKAQKARLDEQIHDAEEDRDETIINHIYDMRQEGLDELSIKLDEEYEKYAKDLEMNVNSLIQSVNTMTENIKAFSDQSDVALMAYLGTFGPDISSTIVTGIEGGLSDLKETALPNQASMEQSAQDLIEYHDNLSPQEFDARTNNIDTQTSAAAASAVLIATRQEKYETDEIARRTLEKEQEDARNELITDSLTGSDNSVYSVINTETGVINKGLTGENGVTETVGTMDSNVQQALSDNAESIVTDLGSVESTLSQALNGGEGSVADEVYNAAKDVSDKLRTISGDVGSIVKAVTKSEAATYTANNTSTVVSGSKASSTPTVKKGTIEIPDPIVENYTVSEPGEFLTDEEFRKKYGTKNSKSSTSTSSTVGITIEIVEPGVQSTANTKKKTTTKKKKYASGTLSAKKGIAEIWEDGPEIITTDKGTFIPFEGGEGVIPAQETANLIKIAQGFKNGKLPLQMPDMSAYKPVQNSQHITNNSTIHIDSLITINGNADQSTVDQLKEIANNLMQNRQFKDNIYNYVTKEQTKDARMAGKRSYMK